MKPSVHDGKQVLHVDSGMNAHSGTVIGQSDDGKWAYVQADSSNHDKPTWDFCVNSAMVPTLAANAKKNKG